MDWNVVTLARSRIRLDPQRVMSLMGGSHKEADAHAMELIREYGRVCLGIMKPSGGYGLPPLDFNGREGGLLVEGITLRTGTIIRKMMQGADTAALLATSIGEGPENLARSLMDRGAYLEGYIVDVIGSMLVEAVTDVVCETIARYARDKGLKTTNRYSPGYCGWDVSEQQKLFSLFDGRSSIHLSESSMMSPVKSITGLVGIGRDVKFNDYPCALCPVENCLYARGRPGEIRA